MIAHLARTLRLAPLVLAAASFQAAQAQTKNVERVSLPGSGYEIVVDPAVGNRSNLGPEPVSEIMNWLSDSFDLPMVSELPHFQFASPDMLLKIRHRGVASDHTTEAIVGRGSSQFATQPEILAVYDDAARTIYLGEGWNGGTTAELSIVVHELVHHVQNVGRMNFVCTNEREKAAYEAQEAWLDLFATDLETEFGLDPFTVLARTICLH